jgi:hypothetical protein
VYRRLPKVRQPEKMQTVSKTYSARTAIRVPLKVRGASIESINMTRYSQTEIVTQVVEEIISGLSLDERVKIANLDEDDIELLQYVFDVYVRSKVGDDIDIDDAKDIMNRLWERLKKTQRLRVIK